MEVADSADVEYCAFARTPFRDCASTQHENWIAQFQRRIDQMADTSRWLGCRMGSTGNRPSRGRLVELLNSRIPFHWTNAQAAQDRPTALLIESRTFLDTHAGHWHCSDGVLKWTSP